MDLMQNLSAFFNLCVSNQKKYTFVDNRVRACHKKQICITTIKSDDLSNCEGRRGHISVILHRVLHISYN